MNSILKSVTILGLVAAFAVLASGCCCPKRGGCCPKAAGTCPMGGKQAAPAAQPAK